MAGKMCVGEVTNSIALPSESRAFCEGVAHRASGSVLAKPISGNPHIEPIGLDPVGD